MLLRASYQFSSNPYYDSVLMFCLLVCPMGMAYHQCSWNLSCSDITGVRSYKDQSPCTSGCFCSNGTILKDGVCSNTSSCSGSYISTFINISHMAIT